MPHRRVAQAQALEHAAGDLAFAHDHQVRAVLFEVVHFGVEVRAGDDVQLGVGRPRVAGDAAGLEAVGNGDQQPARRFDVGQLQHLRIGGVADHHGEAALAQFGGLLALVLDHHQRHPGLAQPRADQAADAAVADEDGVIALAHAWRQVLFRLLLRHGFAFALDDHRLRLLQPLDGDEQQRVDQDRQDRAGQHQVAAHLRQQLQADAQADQDEGELADLRQAGGDGQRGAAGVAEGADDDVGRHRLAEHDDQEGRQHRQRLLDQDRRVEQHANRDEEQHGEGVAQRQRVLRRLVAEFGFVEDHPGEERAEGEGHAEQHRRAIGDAEGDGQHGEGEQFARAGGGDPLQRPGHDAAAAEDHQRDEGGDLAQGQQQRQQQAGVAAVGLAAQRAGQRRQQHQGEDHRQVLDDQPADGDAPALGVDQPALLQRAQQDHGTRHRQRQAEHQPGADLPVHGPGQAHAEHGGDGDLHHRAGNGDGLHREQVLQREVQADAEHQQDHAELGDFLRQRLVGDVAGRERPGQHAGQQVADQRRDAQAVGQGAEDEGQDEAGGKGGQQRCVVHGLGSGHAGSGRARGGPAARRWITGSSPRRKV
ncbi:hypothetical protein D9M68_439840 [compost metagenome]